MSSLKFDLPQLDYTTRFSLWQVKMRAILTQSSDLDEALDGFGKKDAKTWTDDEKRKDHLTNKMHVKMKLFSHKLQEGASMMNHLSIFKEIVSDLLSMEVKYDDEDLALILRDELTLAEVYEALQQREKMKSMVQAEGSSSKAEALQSGDVVRMGDNNPREIVGIGSVQIKMHDGMTRTLTDVRHIPGMARNLISLSTLDVDGDEGIVRHHTIPYTPQQNGVAERMNRTIISKARCMLSNADVTDAVDFSDNSDDEQQRISVQVEHVEEKENDDVVQHSPPVLQQTNSSIAADRPRRNKGPRPRLIEECNLVHHALSCAEQVEHDTEPATYAEAVASVDHVKWFPMQEEMQSLDKNGTWDVVPLPKQKKVVRCKWIFKRKEGLSPSEPPRFKARLVAKGFSQIPGIDYNDVFSPVVKHSSIRAFFGIVAMRDLELEQLDVKTAFLHGELEEEIYMDQPEGFVVPGKEDLVCKLKRSLYGLKQSPRQWYKSQSAIYLTKDQMFHERTKHIDIKYHYIRDIVAQGKLKGSDVVQQDIDWLYRSRRIPAQVSCRIPGDEVEPAPEPGEFVVFLAHFERGFGLPSSDFFRQFLDFYQLQLHHLPGNAIFYLSCFVSFMEAYVGLLPTREAFARFFCLRINSVQGKDIPKPKPPVRCRSCIVGARQGSPFFKFSGLDSCRTWQETFFYVRNKGAADFINLLAYNPETPTMANWSYNPGINHIETNRIVLFLENLKKETDICSVDIICAFISRRVLPLQRRAHKMSQMCGPRDPTKITGIALSKEDVVLKARQICQTDMPMDWEWGHLPLSSMNPPTADARERFPRIAAEEQGPCRKRDLDEVDPDPYVVCTKAKMGRTHTPHPGNLPTNDSGSDDEVTVLEAEVGREFLDNLTSRGKKNKAPAPEAGSSSAPPAKRARQEIGGKLVTKKHYQKKRMPVASGPALKIAKSATGMRPETSEDAARASPPPQPSPVPSGTGNSSASPLGGATSTGRAAPEPSDHRAERTLSPLQKPKTRRQRHRRRY
ncbi:hypothetical protein QYE76_007219 [Lolium multiflorum]|uniref:Gag-pol polyprotein n=1 Tax=Lolium multiflorum TaxID=4521 RepID=A0AAD8RXE1_LOLMU|nr:hypothetical protein QYE76_007219 [Lolium multiflorum]